ncbi:hypothetical protein HCN44_010961 [Aphidius gifuensis]|uniref:Prohormone-3 n=1 Tax=Aphidius gifuensis TaxID=684658 RepID=A0A835CYJ8_APHGI|nr:ITG-like peptide [Aphidius gifuensis]KAF7998553.1 hypothetical protein HCN44_010961 [Aphidius gifuensis]
MKTDKTHGSTAFYTIVVLMSIFEIQGGVYAWGGLFNRFSPEMLSNLGYGGHGNAYRPSYLERPLTGNYANNFGEGLEISNADEPCSGKRCIANEHCCPGQVCIDVDGASTGTCFFAYGLKQGELCRRDNDCETGLMCADVVGADTRSCQPPVTSNKQYSEECTMSGECDITRGLCCQIQRRHRQTTRKVCSYFKDPLVCIGPVAIDQVKNIVQYTSGEKRITNQGINRLLLKRGLFI